MFFMDIGMSICGPNHVKQMAYNDLLLEESVDYRLKIEIKLLLGTSVKENNFTD